MGGIAVYVQRHAFGSLWYYWIGRKPPEYGDFYRARLRDSWPYGYCESEAEAKAAAIVAAKSNILGKPYAGLPAPNGFDFLPEAA